MYQQLRPLTHPQMTKPSMKKWFFTHSNCSKSQKNLLVESSNKKTKLTTEFIEKLRNPAKNACFKAESTKEPSEN